MPEKRTLKRARKAKREGKAATTQAGEFVREEMEHAQRGKHPVKSRKQAIAIGLSKARKSGVKVPAKKRAAKKATKKTAAKRSTAKRTTKPTTTKRRATKKRSR
jgi:hypothetical protein